MPIVGTRYIPETHAGTRDEIIRGLAAEAEAVAESGYMRMHAQGRELERIRDRLRELGADLLGETDEDGDEYLAVIPEHLAGCPFPGDTSGECECPIIARFANPVG
jgi:hypothetical protein